MPNYDTSKNWITALPGITTTTDNNGQMTYDGVHNYTWDAEHKMHSVDANPSNCTTSGECLTYDALGRMVEKAVGSTYTQIVYGPQGRFATMNGQTLVKAFIPLPGAQAVYTSASLNTSNKVAYYRHADHLGSSRLATTPTQTLYSSTAYAPFGEPYSQAGTTDLSFTGQDQDTVSGMHDFLMRKFVPVQGRWLSPDPAGLGAANPGSPQTWNRYAYVKNNPMTFTDPLGLDDAGKGPPMCEEDVPNCGEPPSAPGYPGCVAYGTEGCIPFPCSMPGVSCGGAPGPVTIGGGPGIGGGSGSSNPSGIQVSGTAQDVNVDCGDGNPGDASVIATVKSPFYAMTGVSGSASEVPFTDDEGNVDDPSTMASSAEMQIGDPMLSDNLGSWIPLSQSAALGPQNVYRVGIPIVARRSGVLDLHLVVSIPYSYDRTIQPPRGVHWPGGDIHLPDGHDVANVPVDVNAIVNCTNGG